MVLLNSPRLRSTIALETIIVLACFLAGVRALHILARGYIVRVHVASILSSASLLQRVIRTYLARNRLFKLHDSSARKLQVCCNRFEKEAPAVTHCCGVTACSFAFSHLQSVWKGFKFRVNNEDLMDVRLCFPHG